MTYGEEGEESGDPPIQHCDQWAHDQAGWRWSHDCIERDRFTDVDGIDAIDRATIITEPFQIALQRADVGRMGN